MDNNEVIRLSKRLSELGLCSRREADEFITRGLVEVDGKTIDTLGFKVTRDQKVALKKIARVQMNESVTILVNKPKGYVSSQPEVEKDYVPAIRLITNENRDPNFPGRKLRVSDFENLAVAGRLDIDSQGLLILTQDGRIAKKLIGENTEAEKEYLVRVRGPTDDLEKLRFGLELDGRPLKRAHVEKINADQLRFILKEGRKRQIRRMCEAVGLQVLGLKRVRVGNVRLGKLAEGQWRFLLPTERF